MSSCVIFILFTILLLQDLSHSLRLLEVRIPNYVIKGSTAQLECLYDLDGESLYSVKWYKDGNEFYRYVPRDMPPAQTFLLPGVSVDVHNSSDAIVTLREVNLQSAGRFRCEVSGEAPSFQTVTEHGDMVVVSLPDQGPPKITGGRPRYQIGDTVRINCTAGRSKPAVQLSWFVNGELAEPHHVRKYDTIIGGREGLETSVLGLQFRVEQHHFRNGDMKLKCVASLSTFYWRSNEESVEGDRPQKAPVLESRETVYASNSRADPVQANKTDSSIATIKPSTLILLIALALITSSGCFEQLHLNGVAANAANAGTGVAMKKPAITTKHCRNTKKTEMTNKSRYDDDDDDDKDDDDVDDRDINKVKEHLADDKVSESHDVAADEDGDVSKKLSREIHFNKEMSCLPITMTTMATTSSATRTMAGKATATATATARATTMTAMPVTSMHALNVTTSVSLEQKLEMWLYSSSKTANTISMPSLSSLSSCSPMLLSFSSTNVRRQSQCLVASR